MCFMPQAHMKIILVGRLKIAQIEEHSVSFKCRVFHKKKEFRSSHKTQRRFFLKTH